MLRSGDLVRVDRVWLEIRIDPLLIANANPTSAKALALRLITQALATQGEDGSPRLVVTDGPDAGKSLDLHDVTRRYVVGRSPEVDLVLEDETAARWHIEFCVKGDSLVVKDLGSTSANLEWVPLGQTDSPWRLGQTLRIGKNSLAFEYPAAVALAELSRGADDVMAAGDVPPRPKRRRLKRNLRIGQRFATLDASMQRCNDASMKLPRRHFERTRCSAIPFVTNNTAWFAKQK